jgi:putative membrane protein
MIGRTLAAAAVAALLMAPAAAAQVTQQQPGDTARVNAQDTSRMANQDSMMGNRDSLRMNQPGQMQQPNQAQRPPQAQGQMAAGRADTMPVDTTFLAHAVSGNIKEVRLGELAGKQAENEDVKAFGERMVTAHRQAYKVSRGIADTLSVGTLDSMMAKDQAVVERFSNLEGEAFDSAYMALMVQDHAKEVAEYRNQVQFGENAMIRRYALQTLPTLRDHFELAQRTARDIGVQVQTPLAGEMEAGANDTTAYMAPGRDSALAPADTSFMPVPADSADQIPGVMGQPGDTTMQRADTTMQRADTTMQRGVPNMQRDTTIMPQRDTTMVPGENVPRQAGTPQTPAVRTPADSANQLPGVIGEPGDTTNARPAARDSMP